MVKEKYLWRQNMKTKITNAIILIVVLMCIPFVFSGCMKKEALDEVL